MTFFRIKLNQIELNLPGSSKEINFCLPPRYSVTHENVSPRQIPSLHHQGNSIYFTSFIIWFQPSRHFTEFLIATERLNMGYLRMNLSFSHEILEYDDAIVIQVSIVSWCGTELFILKNKAVINAIMKLTQYKTTIAELYDQVLY